MTIKSHPGVSEPSVNEPSVSEPSSQEITTSQPTPDLGLQSHTSLQNRLRYIDALRGFAAMWVFAVHIHAYWLDSIRPKGISPTRIAVFFAGMGGFGVDLFIVLSGFCLFYPIIRKRQGDSLPFNARAFYRRRAFRLLPAYYVALFLATSLALYPPLQQLLVPNPISLQDILAHLFLVQTQSRVTMGSINGSLWSIALEAQLYLVFPILLFAFRKRGLRFLLLLGIVISIVWHYAYVLVSAHTGDFFDPTKQFPARWIEFIAGMTAATLLCHPRPGQARAAWLLFCLFFPCVIVLHTAVLPTPRYVNAIFGAITFGSLVVALAYVPEDLFHKRTLLALFTNVGIVSYSLYLIHQPYLLLTSPLVHYLHLAPLPALAFGFFIALPVLYGIALVFFTYIEKPFLEWGKHPQQKVAPKVIEKAGS